MQEPCVALQLVRYRIIKHEGEPQGEQLPGTSTGRTTDTDVIQPSHTDDRRSASGPNTKMSRLFSGLLCLVLVAVTCSPTGRITSAFSSSALATSSWLRGWPMVGHDPQRSYDSPFLGPTHPLLLWSRAGFYSLPAITPHGTIVAVTEHGLLALGLLGHHRWRLRAIVDSPPALTPDGTIIINATLALNANGPGSMSVLAVGQNGHLVWQVRRGRLTKLSAPAVDRNGVIYMPYVGPWKAAELDIVSQSGKVLHRVQPGFSFDAVALGRDGTVYATVDDLVHQSFDGLEALRPGGSIRWRHPSSAQDSGPLVSGDGTVYVVDSPDDGSPGWLLAYRPSGDLRWRLRIRDGAATLAERADGTILVAGRFGADTFAAAGKRLWHLRFARPAYRSPSLIVDAAGTAYVGAGDGTVLIVSRQGRVLDRLKVGRNSRYQVPTCVIGPGGRLVVVGADGTLRVYSNRS